MLRADPAVDRVERDHTRATEGAPDDPRYPDQWSLRRIGWDEVRDGPAPKGHAVVAILDTGVDASARDLSGRLLPGVSFVDGVAPDTDPNGHGTWMAGIVGADTDNGTGIAGVAFGHVEVLPVTVLGADGTGFDSAIVAGIVAAVDAGSDVILMAFSARGYSAALQAAVDYAWAHDVVIVAATGNDGSAAPAFPAGDHGVIGVTSTNREDRLAPGANSGPAAFMAAPGVDILTTDAGGGYETISGTSAAAAEVAGAAGLLRAFDPGASNGVIVGRLARSAAPADTADRTGNGRLDLARAAADTDDAFVEPAGVVGPADGGPYVGPYVVAAVRTWTGAGGNNNWTTPANWGGTAPNAGDDLVFPAGAARLANTNDYGNGTAFNSITISGTGYALAGNRIALGATGLSSSAAGSANSLSLQLSFAATSTVTVTSATSSVTLSGLISGAGGLTKAGAGTLLLQVANTYTGATAVNGGTLRLGIANGVGSSSALSVASGATFDLNGFSDTVGSIAGVAGSTITSGAAGAVTLSGGLAGNASTVFAGTLANGSGTVALTKTGTGTLTLSGANTYTAGTTLTGGVIRVQSNGALGTTAGGTTVASGTAIEIDGTGLAIAEPITSLIGTGVGGAGALRNLANANTWSGAIVLGAGGARIASDADTLTLATGGITGATRPLTVTGAGNTTISSVIGTTTGTLAKTGAGTLTLSGTNTYTGATTVSGGVVRVQSNAALGTTANGTSVASGAEIDIDGAGLSIGEAITSLIGTGASGGGALRNLANANTWTGAIALGAAAGATVASDAGTLTLSTGSITGNTRPLTVTGAGDTVIGKVIGTTSGSLTKTGAGTLTLSATNTFSGGTTVSAGVVRVQSSAALGTAAGSTTIAAGAEIDIDGSGLAIAEPIVSLSGAGTSGGGALRNLANTNTWSGAITLVAASEVASDAGTLTLSGTLANGGFDLTVDGAGNVTKTTNAVSGAGGLTKAGAGTLLLQVANTYTGATAVNGGTLRLGIANGVGSSSALSVASGATFDLNGFSDTVGSIAGVAGSTITSGAAGAVTLSGGLAGNASTVFAGTLANGSGTVALTKTGTGTLTLSGANTYTAGTTLTGGVIRVQSNGALGTTAGGTTVASGTAIEIDGTGLAIAEPITSLIGTGVGGAGALRNLANANTWSGAIVLGAGGARIASDADTLTLATGGITGATRPLTVTGAGNTTISSVIGTTTGTLAKTGAGTLTLSGTNTYTGATTVSGGVLSIGADAALGTPPVAVTPGQLTISGATLQGTASFTLNANRGVALAGPGTVTTDAGATISYGGVIAGAGTLTKGGPGTLVLLGVNTYLGSTSITGGALTIGTDAALGTVPGAATPGHLTLDGGALQTTATFTLNSRRGIALASGGATFDTAATTTLTYAGIATGAGSLTKSGGGSLDLAAATASVGSVNLSGGTLVGPTGSPFAVAGNWTNDVGAAAFTGGTGSVTLGGTAIQTVGGSSATTFNSLTIANANGVLLGADARVDGVLTLTTGVVTTGGNTLYVASGGSVARTAGHVFGNLRKVVPTGSPGLTFEVGDATNYTPAQLAFSGVTVGGDLTVSATPANQPQLGSSTLDTSLMAHRYWTLTGPGLAFTSYAGTFTFVASDLDPGANTADFVVERYAAGTWTALVAGTRTATSTQATGITGFGDFAAGELASSALDHFVVTAPGSATAGSAFNVAVTAVDAVGNTVTNYTGTIGFSSTDPYAAFSPASYAFLAADNGTRTFVNGATLNTAGTHTVTVDGSSKTGTSGSITVSAGPFDRLLVLVPGESAVPGSPTGRTGTPTTQTAHAAFTFTVLATDASWNAVSSTHTVAITSSDPAAVLPANAALVGGAQTFSITLETGGPTTVTATDVTDGTKSPGTSSPIPVTNTAPTAVDDSYSMVQDRTLDVAAAGVLANDSDPQGQPITVAAPRPVSGPSHGSLTLRANGSFTYTPDADWSGSDSFTYRATDGFLTSTSATVTIVVASTAYTSSSGWSTSFSTSRYIAVDFPGYVPAGSVVAGAVFTHTYRSAVSGDTTCYYFEVYQGGTLIGTHGSAGSPVSCNATWAWATDVVSLPEVDSVARANNVRIVMYVRNSGAAQSLHRLMTVGVDYSLR